MPQVPGLDTGRRPPEAAQVTDSGVQARLLTGRISRGRLMGTRVLLKVPDCRMKILLVRQRIDGKLDCVFTSWHAAWRRA
jgi:hypothetical protein